MSQPSTSRRLYLIDGNSQMYRAYHALRGLTAPDGRSTNAVYGFVTMLRKLLTDQRPEYIGAAFDVAGPTFRSELAADYKANRAPMPADLGEQVAWVHEACEALGVPVMTFPGFEADDVIGTLARRAVEQGFTVALVTGDKDFFQLVDDHITVFNPRDEGTWYDAAGVEDKFGVKPDHVVDVLALMGDAIDNVKGVPGIGEKGARELIATFGSLDALLEHAAEVPQKKYREALLANVDAARQSRELVRIHTSVDVAFEPDRFRFRGSSPERCFALFSALGFRSLLPEYAPTAATTRATYSLVQSVEELERLRDALAARHSIALEVLVDGPSLMRGAIAGLAFAVEPHQAWYVPVGRRQQSMLDEDDRLPLDDVLAVLRGVLERDDIAKVGHDLKRAVIALGLAGVALRGLRFDTMLASYVVDATKSGHELEPLALERLNYRATTIEEVCGKGAKARSLADVPAAELLTFAGERADLAWQLGPVLDESLSQGRLREVFTTLEMPLVPILAEIEDVGVRVDAAILGEQGQRVDQELGSRSARIFELAGQTFNINSPKQLSEILFDKLNLPASKKTGKTRSASTAVDVLEELALVHELPREILEWRALMKIKGTYIDALPALVDARTGRVHTSFNQAVAATGRLSSSDPNLQNIPIRTELGREIRRAFVSEPGWVLVSADYSQIELRVLAHLAEEPALIDAFRRGEDIHDRTALQVFGPDPAIDRHELRRRAKIINYALLYGKTAFTLAKDIGVPQTAAQAFIDAYFAGFPAVRAYIDRTIAESRESGVVRTLYGRERKVPELSSRNGQIRSAAERVTVNLPIQGTAADIMKLAMVRVHDALKARALRTRLILTVHDELLVEAPEAEQEQAIELVREHMEGAATLAVPLTVDVGVGKNWKDAKP
ncbi:MAG: DNA polymerase I [Vicinamibacterales bacterium]